MNEELHANRKHKDTVFRMLYSDKRAILELYNALNGSDYQNPDDLTITTLENAVYMSMKNDVSFLLDERMTLYEHQSTWNPNMPLRDLLYIARLMEKNVDKDLLYLSEPVKIPAPHFVVFYNGAKEAPEDVTLRLSDAFIQKEAEPELEAELPRLDGSRMEVHGISNIRTEPISRRDGSSGTASGICLTATDGCLPDGSRPMGIGTIWERAGT